MRVQLFSCQKPHRRARNTSRTSENVDLVGDDFIDTVLVPLHVFSRIANTATCEESLSSSIILVEIDVLTIQFLPPRKY